MTHAVPVAERQRRWVARFKVKARTAPDVEALKTQWEADRRVLLAEIERLACERERLKTEIAARWADAMQQWSFDRSRLTTEIAVLKAQWEAEKGRLEHRNRKLRIRLRSGEEERLRLIDEMSSMGGTPRTLGPAGEKVAKLLPMLSSDNDGEALSAVRAIGRTLRSAGLSWHDVSDTFGGNEQPKPKP